MPKRNTFYFHFFFCKKDVWGKSFCSKKERPEKNTPYGNFKVEGLLLLMEILQSR